MARLLGGLAILLTLATSCATTTLTGMWRDPAYTGPPLHKVLVCSISRDDVTRRQIEDAFVWDLQSQGVQAIASYQVIPAGQPTAQQAAAVAQNQGADGVIITMPARVTSTPNYFYGPGWGWGWGPGWAGGPGWGPGWGGAWGWGWGGWGYPYGPAFWDTQVTIQAKAYSLQGKLLWSATSQTLDPSSIHSLLSQIVPRFIYSMAQVGILPATEGKGHPQAVSRTEAPREPVGG